jgi:hypothetical protein
MVLLLFHNEIARSHWSIFEWLSLLDPLLMSKRWEVNSVEVLYQPFSILVKTPGTGPLQDGQFARPLT